MAKAKSPLEAAQAAVDKTASGWKVDRAVLPTVQHTTTSVGILASARPGEFSAWKRRDGNSLIEVIGDSEEQLVMRISEWERAQPQAAKPEPTAEQVANSAQATEAASMTADTRKT
jgi:hypothetical protein